MTGWWQHFERFLATDPRDIGCDAAMGIVHRYVDLVTEGIDATTRYPGLAAHLAACQACAENARGLLIAVIDRQAPPGAPRAEGADPD